MISSARNPYIRSAKSFFFYRYLASYLIICWYLCGWQQLTHCEFGSYSRIMPDSRKGAKQKLAGVQVVMAAHWTEMSQELQSLILYQREGLWKHHVSRLTEVLLLLEDIFLEPSRVHQNVVPTRRINTTALNKHVLHDVMTWGHAQIKWKCTLHSWKKLIKSQKNNVVYIMK